MEQKLIIKLKNMFDDISHTTNEGIEFWYARELQTVLGYSRWENFQNIILKAIISCTNAGVDSNDHFRDNAKLTKIGHENDRNIVDYALTRYACYLIAQCGDTSKSEIAFAQSYFAIQTRKQELIQDRLDLIDRLSARNKLRESEKRLSENIYQRGVDDDGFAKIRSKGDQALFGGKTTQDMKNIYGVKSGALADHLPTLTIAAKNLANEMTNYNVEQNDLRGETPITNEHVQNNRSVRSMLGERGIKPELLSPAEDIKKLERRVKSEEKKLAKSDKLPTK